MGWWKPSEGGLDESDIYEADEARRGSDEIFKSRSKAKFEFSLLYVAQWTCGYWVGDFRTYNNSNPCKPEGFKHQGQGVYGLLEDVKSPQLLQIRLLSM